MTTKTATLATIRLADVQRFLLHILDNAIPKHILVSHHNELIDQLANREHLPNVVEWVDGGREKHAREEVTSARQTVAQNV